MLERLVKYYLNEEKVAIMLESRGKDKDYELLDHIKRKIDCGTYYVPFSYFKKIKEYILILSVKIFNESEIILWIGNSRFSFLPHL